MDQDIATITFQLTRQDYRDAIEAHHRSRRSLVVRVLSILFLAIGSLRLVSGDYVTGAMFFLLGLAYPVLSARVAAYAAIRRRTIPEGHVRLEFHDDHIQVEGPEFIGTIRQLERVALAPRSILLYVDRSQYLVIPRRILRDRDQFQYIVDRARRLLAVKSDGPTSPDPSSD